MHSYRSRIIFAILAVLLSLGAAAVTLHSIYYNSKPDPVWEMHEDFNKALSSSLPDLKNRSEKAAE